MVIFLVCQQIGENQWGSVDVENYSKKPWLVIKSNKVRFAYEGILVDEIKRLLALFNAQIMFCKREANMI